MNQSADSLGPFLVVEGIDGAGKSTVCRIVAERLRGFVAMSNKSICDEPDWAVDTMHRLAGLIWPRTDTDYDHLLPAAYWLHLQAAWYAVLSDLVITPRRKGGQSIVVDGWYYKLVAKLALRGFNRAQLDRAFEHVAQPDQVALLSVQPDVVWDRPRDFRLTELGLHHPDEYPELGRESFIDYQTRIAAELAELARRHGWTVVPVTSTDTPQATAATIVRLVERLGKRPADDEASEVASA